MTQLLSRNKLFILAAILGLSSALDVSLEKTSCDNSLPLTADIYMACSDGGRCSFGEEVTIFGTCK